MFENLISEEFSLTKPSLIISVCGSTKHFKEDEIDGVLQNSMKKTLMKIASNTNAWIIDTGTMKGITKLVGDAVKEDLNGCFQSVLGVASLRRIEFRDKDKKNKV